MTLKNWSLVGVALGCLSLSGCVVGPQQLTRSVDDWDNRLYTESPWMDALLTVVPVIPAVKFVAGVGDFLIVNPIAFWGDDAWDSHGTAFKHYDVKGEDGEMRSLLIDESDLMKVYK